MAYDPPEIQSMFLWDGYRKNVKKIVEYVVKASSPAVRSIRKPALVFRAAPGSLEVSVFPGVSRPAWRLRKERSLARFGKSLLVSIIQGLRSRS